MELYRAVGRQTTSTTGQEGQLTQEGRGLRPQTEALACSHDHVHKTRDLCPLASPRAPKCYRSQRFTHRKKYKLFPTNAWRQAGKQA